MATDDPYQLDRFVRAQADTYAAALAELQAGRKRSHWMWFVFPQFDGLGRSPTAQFYAIKSIAEAHAYLQHPVLGPRLLECTRAVLGCDADSASAVFGYPDDLKFCSSMTLFGHVAPEQPLFDGAIARLCGGAPDERTLALLQFSRD